MCCSENNFQSPVRGQQREYWSTISVHKFSLEMSKILNDKGISALFQIPG